MNKVKILAVDDEQDVLDTIKQCCLDFDVATENLPLKAVERINKEKVDISLLGYAQLLYNGSYPSKVMSGFCSA